MCLWGSCWSCLNLQSRAGLQDAGNNFVNYGAEERIYSRVNRKYVFAQYTIPYQVNHILGFINLHFSTCNKKKRKKNDNGQKILNITNVQKWALSKHYEIWHDIFEWCLHMIFGGILFSLITVNIDSCACYHEVIIKHPPVWCHYVHTSAAQQSFQIKSLWWHFTKFSLT